LPDYVYSFGFTIVSASKTPSVYSVIGIVLFTALLFFVSGRIGFLMVFSHTVLLPLWPPAGVALALVLLFDKRYAAAGIFLGSVIISTGSPWNRQEFDLTARIIITIGASAGRVLEALVGYMLVRRLTHGDLFSSQQNVFRFLFIIMLISSIGATILALALISFDMAPVNFGVLLPDYWFGNVVGILLFAPLILTVKDIHLKLPEQSGIRDFLVFLALIIVTILLLQFNALHTPVLHALPFLAVPYLLWLAFRYPLYIAFSAVFLTSLVALYFTVVMRQGPFIIFESGEYRMLYLQVFIAVISFSTILLGAATRERNVAQARLSELNDNLEQKVRERTHELSKRNAELDNFVYSVSHDLRAPIASILGLINVASRETDAMKQGYLELIRRSALKQDHFIREILEHSKNSRTDLQPQELQLKSLLDEVWTSIHPAEVDCRCDISIEQTTPMVSDRWRLQIIFSNILSNAVRYRRADSVHISVSGAITAAGADITVSDNGQGIPEAHLSKVFSMFYKASESSSGSGLGLYIVREAVTKLGGEVAIQSTLGAGTTVRLSFPHIVTPKSLTVSS
jgi:signal transduction histidine kinase